MTDPVPAATNATAAATLQGFALQGLSWLAFGFFACGGWRAMEWLIRKI